MSSGETRIRYSTDGKTTALTAGVSGIDLEGQVRVHSVSIGDPPEFRQHIVHSSDFFDADTHPLITFRSTQVELPEDGGAVVVGELAIRGVSHEVRISGVHQGPRQVPSADPRAHQGGSRAENDDRPPRLGHGLAAPDAGRNRRGRLGGRDHRTARVRQGGLMRLLGISGSLRSGSHNTELLRAAAASLPTGVDFVLWGGLTGIPAYDEDLDVTPAPEPVSELRVEIERSDALLIATPEYNSSVPGALKNALDWMSRPYASNVLRGKRVAVIGASTGFLGALAAQAELRKVLKTIGADVLEVGLALPAAHTAFTNDGRLLDRELAGALRAIVDDLVGGRVERAA